MFENVLMTFLALVNTRVKITGGAAFQCLESLGAQGQVIGQGEGQESAS